MSTEFMDWAHKSLYGGGACSLCGSLCVLRVLLALPRGHRGNTRETSPLLEEVT